MPIAESRDLFGNNQMRFIGTSKVSTDALGQLFGGKQPIVLNHVAFAMDPFRLNRVEPGALRRQQKGQDTHARARLLDLLVVVANPGAHGLTLMPGGIIPDQEPVGFALREQTLAAPVQELRRERAHWSSGDKAQPHLLTPGLLRRPLLPQHAIASQCFGIRVFFFPRLFDEAKGMLRILPSVQTRQGKATPPHLILETNGPVRLLAGPGNQAVACVFFCRYCGSGLVIQCLARFQLVLSRLSARRTLSVDTAVAMIPCSKLTWAASAKVHTPRSLPKSRGLRCKAPGIGWHPAREKWFGRCW